MRQQVWDEQRKLLGSFDDPNTLSRHQSLEHGDPDDGIIEAEAVQDVERERIWVQGAASGPCPWDWNHHFQLNGLVFDTSILEHVVHWQGSIDSTGGFMDPIHYFGVWVFQEQFPGWGLSGPCRPLVVMLTGAEFEILYPPRLYLHKLACRLFCSLGKTGSQILLRSSVCMINLVLNSAGD